MGCASGNGTGTAAFELRAGDLLPELEIQLTNAGSVDPVNLSAAASAKLVMEHTDGTQIEVTGTLLTPLSAGKVRFTWLSGQTAKKGFYRCWVVVMFPGPKPMTFPSSGADDSDLTIRIH